MHHRVPYLIVAMLAFPGVLALPSSAAEKARTYICRSGTVIWNQAVPCHKDSPERQAVADRIKSGKASLSSLHESSSGKFTRETKRHEPPVQVNAHLGQIQAFPEKLLNVEIIVKDILLRGNVFRGDSRMPEGRRSVVVIEDTYGRSLPVALDEDRGLKFSGTFEPNFSYPLAQVILEIHHVSDGYLVYAKGMSFSQDPPQASEVNFSDRPDPILPEIKSSNEPDKRVDVPAAPQPLQMQLNQQQMPSPEQLKDLTAGLAGGSKGGLVESMSGLLKVFRGGGMEVMPEETDSLGFEKSKRKGVVEKHRVHNASRDGK